MSKKPHYLVLSEKPSLSRTVEAVYKKHASEYDFTCDFMAFAGHLCALKNPGQYKTEWNNWDLNTLPMIPTNFEYVVGEGKTKLFNDIKKAVNSGKYDGIINNCDGDAEGQAIFHTNMMLMKPNLPFLRLWPHDLTESEVDRAFKNLRDEKEDALVNLTHRALLRAQLDWLIGMNGSRAFALTTKSRTVIGRVQTPTLKLIVDRELEIRNFVPQEYFLLNATFKHNKDSYIGTYFNPKDSSMITDKKILEDIKKDLKKDSVIESVETKRVTTYAPALFSLTTLQQEANTKLGLSAQQTLNYAQELYEAKLLSYPRTESTCVTDAIAKTFGGLLKSLAGPITKYTNKITNADIIRASNNKKYVDDKKVGSHYALIPTTESINKHPEVTGKKRELYDLVVARFVAIFMPASVSDKTTIITNSNGHLFRTNGSIMITLGYLELLGYSGTDSILPSVKEKDPVELTDSNIESKFTTPPTRYTDATLIKAMETAGKNITDEELQEELKGLSLGTPATRAGIIERLIETKVVTKQKKVFVPTDLGIWQIQALGNQKIANVDLTAEYEKKLSSVEEGKTKPTEFRNEMLQYIEDLTNELKKTQSATELVPATGVTGKCPKCGGNILENAKRYECEKSCGFKIYKSMLGASITIEDFNNLINGNKTEIKQMVSSKKKKFSAHILLKPDTFEPTLEFATSNTTSSTPSGKVLGKCPCCGKDVIALTGKFGKYYKCDACEFKIGVIAGKSITEAAVKQLLTKKETGIIKGFKSSKGTKFDAKLKLNNGKVEFDFNK